MTKISHLSIDNYCSLYNFELPLRSFNILIGRNDAGKSNILNAIRLLLDDDATQEVDVFDWSRVAKASQFPRQISIIGTLDLSPLIVIRRCVTINKETSPTSVLEVQDGSSWRAPSLEEKQKIPSFYYLHPRTGALQEEFNPNTENYIFTLIKDWMPPDLSEEKSLHKLMRGYAPKETNLMAYAKFVENKIHPALKIAIPSDFPLLQLNVEFRSVTDRGKLFVRELKHSTAPRSLFRLPLDHHGSGLISAIAMVLSIEVLREYHSQLLNNKPFIVAIEEPEVHLHPQAQRTFVKYLKWSSKKNQFIVTTHSPSFVDRTDPENVITLRRAMLKDEKKTKDVKAGTTLAIANTYRKNWEEITETLGVRLSDILMGGEVNLLVEGPTEAILLPAMAEYLLDEQEINYNFDRVFVVIGEGGNLPHIANILKSNGNPTAVIVDNDCAGQNISKKLSKQEIPVEFVLMPDINRLPIPLDQLKECEFEDILDDKILLEIFNETFAVQPGFEFLPVDYCEFKEERMRLFGRGEPFGWIYTVGNLVNKKTTSADLKSKPISEKFSKRLLAEAAAKQVRMGNLPVPLYCKDLFNRIGNLFES